MEDKKELKYNDKVKRKRIKNRYSNKYFSAYAHYRVRKKYPEITREDCAKIIVSYFELAEEDLSLGQKVLFVNKMGAVYLTKEKREVTYDPVTDKITNHLPVNIGESLKLWRNKPELRNKTFIRYTNEHSDGYLYKFHFETNKALFKNKKVYGFKVNRTLKQKLKENIYEKKVDAYTVKRREKN